MPPSIARGIRYQNLHPDACAHRIELCHPRQMGRLLLLFIALPALELLLLIELGTRIGSLETIAVIVLTGIAGATMARNQGLRVLAHVQEQLAKGLMPTDSLVDGILILVASALLVTPGILTDAFGFACLVPGFRSLVKVEVVRRFERAVAENRIHVHDPTAGPGSIHFENEPTPRGPIVDVTPDVRRDINPSISPDISPDTDRDV